MPPFHQSARAECISTTQLPGGSILYPVHELGATLYGEISDWS